MFVPFCVDSNFLVVFSFALMWQVYLSVTDSPSIHRFFFFFFSNYCVELTKVRIFQSEPVVVALTFRGVVFELLWLELILFSSSHKVVVILYHSCLICKFTVSTSENKIPLEQFLLQS